MNFVHERYKIFLHNDIEYVIHSRVAPGSSQVFNIDHVKDSFALLGNFFYVKLSLISQIASFNKLNLFKT
jgi:hypothetical protein